MTAFIEALRAKFACSQRRRPGFRREMGQVRIGPRSNFDFSDSALVYA
jgi:hypothetical protein